MRYTEPVLTVLGDAQVLVQGQTVKNGNNCKDASGPATSNGAYEMDE